MKKLTFLLVTLIFLGSQAIAESYQRWITFVNEPKHVMTASELADITASLGRGEISSGFTYQLSTGITYYIPQPSLFLQYITMCVKEGEPSIITTEDVARAIKNGEVVRWGNDINVKVRNYYFSSLHSKVQFIDNYSGADIAGGVFVLLINGKPKIKMDCGNPLLVIGGEVVQTTPTTTAITEPVVTVFTLPVDLGQSYSKPIDLGLAKVEKTKTKTKTWLGRNWPWLAPVILGTVYGAYRLLDRKGSPGGAPLTPAVIPPGGPGGAPLTH